MIRIINMILLINVLYGLIAFSTLLNQPNIIFTASKRNSS